MGAVRKIKDFDSTASRIYIQLRLGLSTLTNFSYSFRNVKIAPTI